MSCNTVRYAPTLAATGDTNRGPSQAIWRDCPVDDLQQDPRVGMYFFDDFTMTGNTSDATVNQALCIGQWAAFVGTNGVVAADPNLEGGVLAIGAGANSGVSIAMSSMVGAFRMLTTSTLALNQKLWFECRVAVDSVTSGDRDAFIGLSGMTTQPTTLASKVIGATNVLDTTDDKFGFHFRNTSNPTDVAAAFVLAAGTVNYPTGLTTLSNTVLGAALTARSTSSGFIKLGFLFDPQPSVGALQISSATARQTAGQVVKPLIRFFVNGIQAATFLSSADVANSTSGQAFPTAFMAPAIAYTSRSANSNNFNIDWIRIAQLANS